jgi:hypothetical protein
MPVSHSGGMVWNRPVSGNIRGFVALRAPRRPPQRIQSCNLFSGNNFRDSSPLPRGEPRRGSGLSHWADGAWTVWPGSMTARSSVANTLPLNTEVIVIYHLTCAKCVCHLEKVWQTLWQTLFPRTVRLERGLPGKRAMIPRGSHLDLLPKPGPCRYFGSGLSSRLRRRS